MYGGQYIPDLTERFPEGFGGVDLTDKYFPCERRMDSYEMECKMWEMMKRDFNADEEEEEEDFILKEVD